MRVQGRRLPDDARRPLGPRRRLVGRRRRQDRQGTRRGGKGDGQGRARDRGPRRRTARRRRDLVRDQNGFAGQRDDSAATTPRKASTAIAPCASPRRGPRFCRRGSMRSQPRPLPPRQAKKARGGSRRRGPSSPEHRSAARPGVDTGGRGRRFTGQRLAAAARPWQGEPDDRSKAHSTVRTGRLLRAAVSAAARTDRADDCSLGVTPVREVTRRESKPD